MGAEVLRNRRKITQDTGQVDVAYIIQNELNVLRSPKLYILHMLSILYIIFITRICDVP